jgi:hypothetical protein
MKVIPINKTIPDINIRFLNWSNQYRKKSPFKIKKKGKTRVKTDKTGNVFGAKKGKT